MKKQTQFVHLLKESKWGIKYLKPVALLIRKIHYFCHLVKRNTFLYNIGPVVQLVTPSARGCLSRMKYYSYILQSEMDESFYIGHTNDVYKRLDLHNQGKSKYTSKKIPWRLVYFEEFETRKEARSREDFLKKQRNRSFYKKLIDNWSGSSVG